MPSHAAPWIAVMVLVVLSGMAQAVSPLQVSSQGLDLRPGPTAGRDDADAEAPSPQDIQMPMVSGARTEAVAQINHALYAHLLATLAPPPGKAFKAPEGWQAEQLTQQRFTVLRQDDMALVLAVTQTYCAPHCWDDEQTFHFDAASGRLLLLDDLLSPTGLQALALRWWQWQVDTYQTEVVALRSALKARQKRPPAASTPEEDLARLALYTRCLESLRQERTAKQLERSLRLSRFTLDAADGLRLVRGRCSSPREEAYDEVGALELPLKATALAPHLSPWAKAWLHGGATATPPTTRWTDLLLQGQIGKVDVDLWLYSPASPSDPLRGLLQYRKHGRPISIQGQWKGPVLELQEVVDGNPQATLRLQVQGGQLRGQWAGGGKAWPMVLTR